MVFVFLVSLLTAHVTYAQPISVDNSKGEDVTVNSGSADDIAVIDTTGDGDDATGIFARSRGTPPRPANDPFLGIPIPGTPLVSGGVVTVNSYTDITTNGENSHGIHAVSSTTGFPGEVKTDLENFDPSTVTFSITSVVDDNGVEVGTGTTVAGSLLYRITQTPDEVCDDQQNPNCERVDPGNPEDVDGTGGSFVINADGTASFDPGTDFDDLEIGETITTGVSFTLFGDRQGNTRDDIAGMLVARVTRNADGELEWSLSRQFDDYGTNALTDDNNTIWPDLGSYVDGLIRTASAGGSGNSVTVNFNDGTILTRGAASHGILAQSFGRGGSPGDDGGGFLSFGFDEPEHGTDGYDGGTINVHVDGNIITTYETPEDSPELASIGVFAYTHGGDGGRGGDGGTYYNGRRGGRGGLGGDINITGSGTISTVGDFATGILALSEGGNGGNGGDGGIFTDGYHGGFGGVAGIVDIDGSWNITTQGDMAHGIWAKSLGGSAGRGGSGGWIAGAAGDGGQGAIGGTVNVTTGGRIETFGDDAFAIYAQSVGGFGGAGGLGLGVFAAAGGDGSAAGSGGDVFVHNLAIGPDGEGGLLITRGSDAHALYAQSIGGGGGSGGGSAAGFVAIGGAGGSGGNGGLVDITNDGEIWTFGQRSYGIYAQSVGGGGGDGGAALARAVSLGGEAGDGSAGGHVSVRNSVGAQIVTAEDWSNAIYAQSIGGGGGTGGLGAAFLVGIGGAGGSGDDGGVVFVDNDGFIQTLGFGATGIHAESIGGGGGSGGGALAGVFSLGGGGGGGGHGGTINIFNDGDILTDGDLADGIFATSIGGSGGNGGSSLALLASVGGRAGAGADGGVVNVTNNGLIHTLGANATGIFAQSVGGSGGNGGSATVISPIPQVSLGFTLGGNGGSGGDGKTVNIWNNGTIRTDGQNSHAVYAQSVGGSGGTGGAASTISFMVPLDEAKIPSIQAGVSIGGQGAGGGVGGDVTVINTGLLETLGYRSFGVYAQSVGGSGGDGGNATTVTLGTGADFSANVSIGGAGGDGGVGGNVKIVNDETGAIHTMGDYATAVFAQSVGGGGGAGGNATSVDISLTPFPVDSPDPDPPTPSFSLTLAVGGDGGDGALGGEVRIDNEGLIWTEGDFANGVMAQSVGGSGGVGGDATTINIEFTADPMDYLGLPDPMSYDMTMRFGGDGGTGGDGGYVRVDNDGDVVTEGAFSHGIVAQSVGGGGGAGGSALTFDFSTTNLLPFDPPGSSLPDPTSLEMSLVGSGGGGGSGGNVDVHTTGNITTYGDFSTGIIAQSVGAGGGSAGLYNPLGITGSEFLDNMIGLVVETDAGTSFFGSVGFDISVPDGPDGDSGNVYVNHAGDITTFGDAAHGVLAQTATSAGVAGTIGLDYYGTIYTGGEHSYGVYAQSGGGLGSGDITINLFDNADVPSMVVGGSGMGAGLRIAGGNNNTIYSEGLIASIDGVNGIAIIGGAGHETVDNYGELTGNVWLGAGNNRFSNYGLVNSGTDFYVGVGNLLLNEGDFSIGGVGNILTTTVTGDFTHTTDGTLWFDLGFDFGNDDWDRLHLTGSALLEGMVGVNLFDTGKVLPGEWEAVLITTSTGFDVADLGLLTPASAVIGYDLYTPNGVSYALGYNVDFAAAGLNSNQAAMGEHFNAIQLAGNTGVDMQALVASVVAQPDLGSLGAAYDMLSPHIYTANQSSRMYAHLDFTQSMKSCPIEDGDFRFSSEGRCTWMRASDRNIEYEGPDGGVGASDYSKILTMGYQWPVSRHWYGGLALGFERTELEIPLASEQTGTEFQLGGILKGRYGPNLFDVTLAYADSGYSTERLIGMPSPENFLVATRDSKAYGLHVGYAYSLERARWYLRPGIDLGWIRVTSDAIEEAGGGAAGLSLLETDDKYYTGRVDLKVGTELGTPGGALYRPYLNVAHTRVFAGTTNEIRARLHGAPDGVSYFTQVLEPENSFTSFGTGVQIFANREWAFLVAYDHTYADDWDSDSWMVRAQRSF